jgi:uncharacterized protein
MDDQDDPFSPSGVTWQAVNPRLATGRRLAVAPLFVVLASAVAVVAWVADQPAVGLAGVPLLGLWLWVGVLIGRQVRSLGYAERDDDLLIRKGVLLRSIVVVPYGRMQFIDVQAGPLARKLGYGSLQLHTASTATQAAIPGLAPAESARLRDQLAQRGEADLAGL